MSEIFYDPWARQRIIEKLGEICRDRRITEHAIAAAISRDRGIPFSAMNLTRLKVGGLNHANVDSVVNWIVLHHDENFRLKLSPDGQIRVLSQDMRDFYSQQSAHDPLRTDTSNQIAGLYLCVYRDNVSSFISTKSLEALDDWESFRPHYLWSRSLLALHHAGSGCFYCGEISLLRICSLEKPRLGQHLLEGFGFYASDQLRIFLRDSLTRTPKQRVLSFKQEMMSNATNPVHRLRSLALNFKPNGVQYQVKDDEDIIFKREHQTALDYKYIVFSQNLDYDEHTGEDRLRQQVCLRKPDDMLKDYCSHFPNTGIFDSVELNRILRNPLFGASA